MNYHLLPLGERLRARGITNRIGFFLHIPWPPTRLFVSLPFHERLVRTMLEYDLIGFQTDEWPRKLFCIYCREELGAKVDQASGTDPFRREHRNRPGLSDRNRLGPFSGAGRDRGSLPRAATAWCPPPATARR